MKKTFLIILAICVAFSFNVPLVSATNYISSTESANQSIDLLNETFVEYDYETRQETTFSYASVIDSLKQINPDYTDYTIPFSIPNESTDLTFNSNESRTVQTGSSFTLIKVYEEPYTYTMRIQVIKSNGTSSYGTGFMISKYVMLTCAHIIGVI